MMRSVARATENSLVLREEMGRFVFMLDDEQIKEFRIASVSLVPVVAVVGDARGFCK